MGIGSRGRPGVVVGAETPGRRGALSSGGGRKLADRLGNAMTSRERQGETGREAEAGSDKAGTGKPATPDESWLLPHKVALPDAIEGYIKRPEVEMRCGLTDRRLTVLHAPGGFGKTAVLGSCCRALRSRGVAVAWVSLDEEDGPESITSCLALAFERAGVGTFKLRAVRGEAAAADAPDPEADSPAEYRMNELIRAVEGHGGPCVLALDEVERLRSSKAIGTINSLLRRAPHHLHVGMAFRERPPGLAIAMFALEGRSVTVTAEELRFSAADISRFFERKLSRRELAAVVADSAGWPLALHIHRNAMRPGARRGASGDDTVAGWVETRLWRGLSAEDRSFLLDIALFDRLDPELIDEVTGVGNAGRRIGSMGALAGLVSTAGGGGPTVQLHPLLKDYCEKRRFEETPERFRALHRGIARALARRGRVVEALRHASEAGDAVLLGQVAESTGGVRLWLEQGLEAIRTVDGLLTGEVLSKCPRLALVRCVVLTAAGDIGAAKRVYEAGSAETAGFTRDREGGDDRALQLDHIFVEGMLRMCGFDTCGAGGAAARKAAAKAVDSDPLLRGMFSLGMCMFHEQTAAFDAAIEWAGRARAALARTSPYLPYVDFHCGSVAMARGRTGEARRCYDRGLKVARASRLRDSGTVMIGEVLAAELELELSAGGSRRDEPCVSPRLLGMCIACLDVYAASLGVRVELALVRGARQEALAAVEDAREYARRTERRALARFVAALRVSVLLAGGEVDEAARAWRFDGLPERAVDCLDLERGWREVEVLACARLRLFIARGELEAGRDFAAALLAVAAERTLVRTWMRALVPSMVLEHQAGAPERARAHLLDYLRLFAETDYAWPLARDRAVALALLDEISDAPGADAAVAAAAGLGETLRADGGAGRDPSDRPLSDRELDVLTRLERQSDKEIAQALKLSYDGVRYRVRSIFSKLGARSRLDAVHRARARGILPAAEDVPEAEP